MISNDTKSSEFLTTLSQAFVNIAIASKDFKEHFIGMTKINIWTYNLLLKLGNKLVNVIFFCRICCKNKII